MSHQQGFTRNRFAFFILAMAALCGLVLLLALEMQRSRERELEFAQRDIDALTETLAQHANGTIGKIDVVLRKVARDYPWLASLPAHDANRELRALLDSIPESQSLRIADSTGHIAYDASGIPPTGSIADRNYFKAHRDNPDSGLVISEPIFARFTHNWVFTVSRRLISPDGAYVGHVQGAVNADYFENFYRTLNIGEGGLIALLDNERRLIARYPAKRDALGKVVDSAPVRALIASNENMRRFREVSPIDGVDRILAAHRVEGMPFVIVIGRSTNEVLTSWRNTAFSYAVGISVLGFALAALILLWQRSYHYAWRKAGNMADALATNEKRSRVLLDSLPDPAWLRDEDSRFVMVNDAYLKACNKKREEVIGKRLDEVWLPSAASRFREQDDLVCRERIVTRDEGYADEHNRNSRYYEYIRSPVLDEDGRLIGIAGFARDLTEHKQAEDRIRYIAEHDHLTDLPNRLLLNTEMSRAIAGTVGNDAHMALLFLDIDRFKNVNDTLGHNIGDQLLLQVAERLRETIHADDTISRQGGDEFAILLVNCANSAMVAVIAQRVLDAIARPFMIGDHELSVTGSIGISIYPEDGADIDALLKAADTAMYSAKSAGGGSYRFFKPEMNARIRERMQLEHQLRRALEREELELHYQPQYDLADHRMIGVEALLRWHQHEHKGYVSPARFIPVAEDTGLIQPIGEWVLTEACRQGVTWDKEGVPEFTIAVNVSAAQLTARNLVGIVASALDRSGLPAHRLELELTESALMADQDRAITVLNDLRRLGVKLAVDDFGTGYSSLSYLKHLPIDKIKIDQSFIRDITTDRNDAAITQAIIAIAAKLELRVIAEGVEADGQLETLRAYGCNEVQGYHLGRPMPPDELIAHLRRAAA